MLDALHAAGPVSTRRIRLWACACCRAVEELLHDEVARKLLEVTEDFLEGKVHSDVQRDAAIALILRLGEQLRAPQEWEAVLAAGGLLNDCIRGWRPSGHDLWPIVDWSSRRLDPLVTARRAAHCAAWAVALHADRIGAVRAEIMGAEDAPADEEYVEHAREMAARLAPETLWARAYNEARLQQANLLRDIFATVAPIPASVLAWNGGTVVSLARAAYENGRRPSGHLDRARLCVLADGLEEAGHDDAGLLAHLRWPGRHVRGCAAIDAVLGRQ